MSWHFSQALVAEFSAGNCSAGELSAQLKSNPTPQAFLCSGRMTDFSRISRYGMTFALLTDDHGAELLTSFLAVFPAKTSAQREKAQASTESAADFGLNSLASFARYNPATHSLKTAQRSLLEDLTEFSVTLPRWGSMQNGALYQQQTLVLRTGERESGLSLPTPTATNARQGINSKNNQGRPLLPMAAMRWPTPCSRDYKDTGENTDYLKLMKKGKLAGAVMTFPTTQTSDIHISGQLNPNFVEWLMGWGYEYTKINTGRLPFSRKEITEKCLRAMLSDQEFTGTSQGRGYREQLAREYPNAMRALSHETSLERGEKSVAEISTLLLGLRKALYSWPLRNAQEPFEAAWQSATTKEKSWIAMATIRGVWHAEWPNVPRVQSGIPARVDRIKAIGNGQVPQCAAEAWRLLNPTGE